MTATAFNYDTFSITAMSVGQRIMEWFDDVRTFHGNEKHVNSAVTSFSMVAFRAAVDADNDAAEFYAAIRTEFICCAKAAMVFADPTRMAGFSRMVRHFEDNPEMTEEFVREVMAS